LGQIRGFRNLWVWAKKKLTSKDINKNLLGTEIEGRAVWIFGRLEWIFRVFRGRQG